MISCRIIRIGHILPAILLLAGCYSMDIASNAALDASRAPEKHLDAEQGKAMPREHQSRRAEHVVVSNYGWYLFKAIPLACGNTAPKSFFPWAFFSDQVSPKLLHDRMMSYASATNANVKELAFFRDEQVFFTIPGTQFPVPIPYILCFREIQFSGVLTPRPKEVRQ